MTMPAFRYPSSPDRHLDKDKDKDKVRPLTLRRLERGPTPITYALYCV